MQTARQQNGTAYPMEFFLEDSAGAPVAGATPTVTLSKNGAAFAAAAGAVTELAHGWYKLAGNATDRNALGELLLHATAAGAEDHDSRWAIVGWDPFAANLPADLKAVVGNADAASGLSTAGADYFGTGRFPSSVGEWAGFAVAAGGPNNRPLVRTAEMGPGAIDAAAIAADALLAIANKVEAEIIDETDTEKVLEAIVNKINAMTDLDALTLAAIGTAARDAILDRVLAANHETAGSVGKLLQFLDATISSRNATTPPTAAANADAVWDEALVDHATGGSAGKKLSDLTSGGGGGGLSGPSSVTLTFKDAAAVVVPLVDFTIVGQGSGRANASGAAAFGLADGTYTVVSRPTSGTLFANATLIVSGTTALTITGTAITITPAADPAETTAYLTSYTNYDGQGAVKASLAFTFRLRRTLGAAGYSFDTMEIAATSAAVTGLLEVTLLRNRQYEGRRGSGPWIPFTTADAATSKLPEILGKP